MNFYFFTLFKFAKPGKQPGDYPDWAKEAVQKALKDAKLQYRDIQQACVGFCYGELLRRKLTNSITSLSKTYLNRGVYVWSTCTLRNWHDWNTNL